MGFWLARARKVGCGALVASVVFVAAAASSVSATPVSLPNNAIINMVGDTETIDMSIDQVTNLESVAVSFVFNPTIVSVGTVQRGTLVSSCDTPVVNTATAGRLTITMTCSSMPISGAGQLFTIAFTGVNNGVSPLTFSTLMVGDQVLIPNGCQLNEGSPTCEPANGQITVGPGQPTITASATASGTATRTGTATATHTVTATSIATVTDTPTIGPSPTASHTGTITATGTITQTPTQTPLATNTATQSPTRTITNTAAATATRPAIPVAPSPTSPAGLALVAGLGTALLWALRRLRRS